MTLFILSPEIFINLNVIFYNIFLSKRYANTAEIRHIFKPKK